jgi:hypothetical protein
MTCLVHDTHYRSLFHAVVNELRNENRTPVSILRSMPHKCCTCNDIDTITLISVLIHDKDQLIKLKNLINRIEQEKESNPKLVLALNLLENFIKENRGPVPEPVDNKMEEGHVSNHCETSSSFLSDSEDNVRMNTRKPKQKTKQSNKPPKPIKNGTFLFLPYQFENEEGSNESLIAAKTLQRGRFIGRNGNIPELENAHDARINMITSKTTEQVTKALEKAKSETGKVIIHNRKDIVEGEDGEWILIRPKKSPHQNKTETTTDFTALLDDLTSRWKTCLKMKKRQHVADDEDEEQSNKK